MDLAVQVLMRKSESEAKYTLNILSHMDFVFFAVTLVPFWGKSIQNWKIYDVSK